MSEPQLEHEEDRQHTLGNQPKAKLNGQTYQKVRDTPDIEQRLEAVGKSTSEFSANPKYHLALIGSVQGKVDAIKDGQDPLFTLDEMKVLDSALSSKQVDRSQELQNPLNELNLPQRGKEDSPYNKVASPNSRGPDSSQNLPVDSLDMHLDEFATRGKNSSPVEVALAATALQREEEKKLALAA